MVYHNYVVVGLVEGKRVRRNYKTYFGAMRFLSTIPYGSIYYFDLSCTAYRHLLSRSGSTFSADKI